MKFEKTCKCLSSVSFGERSFKEGREYQVDILLENGDEIYKVYQDGTDYNFILLSFDDFSDYFKEID